MDSSLMPPTISASEVIKHAEGFAKELADRLAAINSKHLTDPEAKQYIETVFAGLLLGQPPNEFLPLFQKVFIEHMASYWVIVSDQG